MNRLFHGDGCRRSIQTVGSRRGGKVGGHSSRGPLQTVRRREWRTGSSLPSSPWRPAVILRKASQISLPALKKRTDNAFHGTLTRWICRRSRRTVCPLLSPELFRLDHLVHLKEQQNSFAEFGGGFIHQMVCSFFKLNQPGARDCSRNSL